ncbi:four helix bundle protein [Algoriphagus sp. C2-6-M1]
MRVIRVGSQLRRSSNSVNTNIIEGYGSRSYKIDVIYSHEL